MAPWPSNSAGLGQRGVGRADLDPVAAFWKQALAADGEQAALPVEADVVEGALEGTDLTQPEAAGRHRTGEHRARFRR